MGTKDQPGRFDCFAALEPDEPYFLLMGRDAQAPALVDKWADMRRDLIILGLKPASDMAKVDEARALGTSMRRYHSLRRARKANALDKVLDQLQMLRLTQGTSLGEKAVAQCIEIVKQEVAKESSK